MLQSKKKSMALTTILAFLVMGVGHIYVGRIKRGIVLLVAGLVTGTLITGLAFFLLPQGKTSPIAPDMTSLAVFSGLTIGLFVLFIWQIINARKECKKYNSAIV